jgi:hypothetical protein
MKKTLLLAIFCAFLLSTSEARANIYGLLVLAENPALNLMQGTSLMLMSYEEGAYYRLYLEAYQFEGQVFRSGGSSGTFDCYPAYPGLCAIVPTQTEIDFDNPDPSILEADFYIDTVFVQEVAPGVYYGYDPAYYFGFGGGEYPPEYTFAPCWCGGYVQVVRIYLGTLGVLLPKPVFYLQRLPFTGAISDPSPNALQDDITNMTQSIMVGEQVYVKLTGPSNRPPQGLVYTAEGNAIEDWVVTYNEPQDPNSKAEIKPLRTNLNPILIMWPFGSFTGTTYKLQCAYLIYGRAYVRRTFYKVFRPNVEVDADFTNQITVDDKWDPDVPTALHLGELNEFRPGIRFTLNSATAPPGFTRGAYEWVQVVEETSERSFGHGTTRYVKKGGGLDTKYPYAQVTTLQNSTSDSPGIGMTSIDPIVSANDSFLMYLMFIPDRRDDYTFPKYVPLKEIVWGWRANAVGTYNGVDFVSAELTNVAQVGPGIGDANRYPRWSRNWTSLIYVEQ